MAWALAIEGYGSGSQGRDIRPSHHCPIGGTRLATSKGVIVLGWIVVFGAIAGMLGGIAAPPVGVIMGAVKKRGTLN
jgi:hypothetical protein